MNTAAFRLLTIAMPTSLVVAALALTLAMSPAPARAADGGSTASQLSGLAVVSAIAAPVSIVAAGSTLVIDSVVAVGRGANVVVHRASDGVSAVLTMSAAGAGALSLAAGTVVEVATCSTGYVLSAAGSAIAFIPNKLGASLLYEERVTR